ncbi:hypothetical protein FHW18_001963 [Pigmentiphaga litoralis]|uniref:Uncharacterized protein n=1 Tax=Pigmentiphaga litoralis TaxID=516702 RepID=A0A7Y9ITB0_9BURK|nr:hypothetical protein [Pigmentiphaga litoralis]NYE82692.1 hypothetical protein [Pigmentiphaga litoralis]
MITVIQVPSEADAKLTFVYHSGIPALPLSG